MKRSYESPETLNRRNREFRQRMREKGMKYISLWIPAFLEEKIKKMVEKWKSEND